MLLLGTPLAAERRVGNVRFPCREQGGKDSRFPSCIWEKQIGQFHCRGFQCPSEDSSAGTFFLSAPFVLLLEKKRKAHCTLSFLFLSEASFSWRKIQKTMKAYLYSFCNPLQNFSLPSVALQELLP